MKAHGGCTCKGPRIRSHGTRKWQDDQPYDRVSLFWESSDPHFTGGGVDARTSVDRKRRRKISTPPSPRSNPGQPGHIAKRLAAWATWPTNHVVDVVIKSSSRRDYQERVWYFFSVMRSVDCVSICQRETRCNELSLLSHFLAVLKKRSFYGFLRTREQ